MSSPPRHPMRLRDIAEKLGVSTMTVSLALRAHPSISKARVAEVREAARKMGYRPNAMASALAHRKWTLSRRATSTTLAWLNCWDDPRDLRRQREFDLYWKGAASAADHLGYQLKEVVWNAEMPHARLRKILLARNIPGLVIPPHPIPPNWSDWDFAPFSLVRIGHSVSNLPVHVITPDQVQCSLLAFREARKRGYRRVGLVSSAWAERHTLFDAGFLLGQIQAAVKAVIPILRLADARGMPDARDVLKLEHWMRRFRPDAILTDVNDLGHMLASLKTKVPEDVGLAMLSTPGGTRPGSIRTPSRSEKWPWKFSSRKFIAASVASHPPATPISSLRRGRMAPASLLAGKSPLETARPEWRFGQRSSAIAKSRRSSQWLRNSSRYALSQSCTDLLFPPRSQSVIPSAARPPIRIAVAMPCEDSGSHAIAASPRPASRDRTGNRDTRSRLATRRVYRALAARHRRGNVRSSLQHLAPTFLARRGWRQQVAIGQKCDDAASSRQRRGIPPAVLDRLDQRRGVLLRDIVEHTNERHLRVEPHALAALLGAPTSRPAPSHR